MKIGLDIDGVLCNFVQGILDIGQSRGLSHFPKSWDVVDHWLICDGFVEVMKEVNMTAEFWLKLKPLPYSLPLDFTPDCYITARPIESWVTQQWLDYWRFPKADLITVANPVDKLAHIQERQLDIFIDDHYETIPQLRTAGVNAILFDAPYQRGHDVAALPKIKHLSEVLNGNWGNGREDCSREELSRNSTAVS
jgi:hypothetical protein